MISRIMKLPKHDNVIVGRDLSNAFEAGAVYDVKKIQDQIIITKIGMTRLSKSRFDEPNENSDISSILLSGKYLLTENDVL